MRQSSTAPATDRQIAYIKDLLHSRVVSDAQAERCRGRLAAGTFTVGLASQSIDWFLAQPKRQQVVVLEVAAAEKIQQTVAELEIGIYELDGKIYKVKASKAGHKYAQVLNYTVGDAERLTAAGTIIKGKYEYVPGMITQLRPEHRVTGARAEELSIVFTFCIVCGRHLVAAQSVARGIGPVCAKRV